MARITVEDCLQKIPNRFQLVLAATYRARMLSQGHAPKIETKNKPGVTALREIDRRIRFLTQRLDIAEVADPSLHHGTDQVFFGATVTYANAAGEERTVTIKGIDEADSLRGEVSWISPIARALLKAREGDQVQLVSPGGVERIEVLAVRYPAPGQENR